ncbi:hypothetical protein [Vallitalea okinawensis]|uniref:hypothetical protein n=1 Tax=Vallitalea okinawensis TaxID=2078660 RepID=UPI00130070C6|nr:hypothetical protein [Vallitalea okinawensis]
MFRCFQSEITINNQNIKLDGCKEKELFDIAVKLNRTFLNSIAGFKAELVKSESKVS